MVRKTNTGYVLEQMVLPALERGGYEVTMQVETGLRPGGRRHYVDVVAKKDDKRFLISLKWQQTSGTAEQKVPFEVISLLEAMGQFDGEYTKSYVVLGGGGWTLRDYYTSGELEKHLKYSELIDIMDLESFIGVANNGEL